VSVDVEISGDRTAIKTAAEKSLENPNFVIEINECGI
jgi:hypothetical protein